MTAWVQLSGAAARREHVQEVKRTAGALRRLGRLLPTTALLSADVAALTCASLTVRDLTPRVAVVAAGLAVLVASRGYRYRLTLSVLDDLPTLVSASVAPAVVLFVLPGAPADSSSNALRLVVVTCGLLLGGRAVAYSAVVALRRVSALRQRAVIVGAGAVGTELHALFNRRRQCGMDSVGIVDDVPVEPDLPLLGGIHDIGRVIDEHGASVVVAAFGPRGEQDLVPVLRAVQHLDIDVMIVPRFYELVLAPSGPDVETIWGIPLYRVRRSALGRWNWPVKRTMDVVAAGVALALAGPLLAGLALAVRLSSPGPILFRQVRIGQHGRPFEVLKFRTMRVNDDSDVTWNVQQDPRVTPIGGWLRRLSLDELPQLWNVLRGDMSMVGPRPERPHFVDQFCGQVAGYSDRHRVPVGLTGLAQIHGLRGDTSIAERARFDNAYVEHWSPWFDVKIVLRTVAAIVRDALADRAEEPAVIDTDPGAEVVALSRPGPVAVRPGAGSLGAAIECVDRPAVARTASSN